MRELIKRYGLGFTHFQSHYLPHGWQDRTRHFDRFGRVDVRLVDPYDIFVGKLFSRRPKDLDDLLALARQLDRSIIEERLRSSAATMLSDASLPANAAHNWYIIFGDDLPSS